MIRKLQVLLLGLFVPVMLTAQSGSLTGTVTDANDGNTLPGAYVLLPEIDKGTATDADGNYTIKGIPSGTYIAKISYVGYKTKELEVTIGTTEITLDIELESDFLGLDEVVVTGVGAETSKRKLAINVESVSGEDLLSAPATTLDNSLAGKIAGANIVPSGNPGAPSAIFLRGINTMGTSRPLILIDGVEIDASNYSVGTNQDQSSRLADIDFNDIKRVEVVKGAAAATLYGAQGANGVIQIFTKSGEAGKTKVSVSSNFSFDQLNESEEVPMIERHGYPTNSDGYILGMRYNPDTGVWTIPDVPTGALYNNEYIGYLDANGNQVPIQTFDNLDNYYRTGVTQTHRISVSGGSKDITYLASVNNLDQQGIEEKIGFSRISARLNTDANLSENLKLKLRTNFINSDRAGITESGDNIQSGLNYVLSLPVFIDAQDKDSEGNYRPKQVGGSVSTNGLFFKQITDLSSVTNRAIGNMNLGYTPLDWLAFDYTLGVDYYYTEFDRLQENAENFENPNTQEDEVVLLTPRGYFERNQYSNRLINSIFDTYFNFDFGRDFGMNIPLTSTTLLKFDYRRNTYDRTTSTADQLTPGIDLSTINAGSVPSVDGYESDFITYGFLVNQRFDWGDSYGITAGVRADRSSAFGNAGDYSFFPRADGYIRISNYSFWNPIRDYFTDFKIRGAYGEAGTQPGAFERQITLTSGFIGNQGVYNNPFTLSNRALQVEESAEYEIGSEMAFMFGKKWLSNVALSATYWNRSNNGAIEQVEVAPSTGSSQIVDNAVDLSSEGFDLSVNALVYFSNSFNWRSSVNFGFAENRVEEISNGEDLLIQGPDGVNYLFRENSPFGAVYGLKALRSVDELDSEGNRYIAEDQVDNFAIVDGIVVDNSTKRVQFRDSQELIANPTPDFNLSFLNQFDIYRNLRISTQIDMSYGGDIYNKTKWWMYASGTHGDIDDLVLIDGGERVGEPNGTGGTWAYNGNEPQAYSRYHLSKRTGDTEFFVEDGSYVKIREISVSYDFADILGLRDQNIMESLKLGVSGRNLLTFTSYSGFDPEVSQGGQDARFRGLDTFTYPNYRTFSVNLSAKF